MDAGEGTGREGGDADLSVFETWPNEFPYLHWCSIYDFGQIGRQLKNGLCRPFQAEAQMKPDEAAPEDRPAEMIDAKAVRIGCGLIVIALIVAVIAWRLI